MPASTSSKIRVGTSSRSTSTLRQASIVRESSPPEATFASGCAGCPGPPENTNAACSAPPDVSSGFGTRVTSIEAPSIPSSPSSRWSACAELGHGAGTAVRDRGGQRPDALGAFGDLGGGALPLLLHARERVEALPCPVPEREHLLLAVAVLALERVERADPLAHLLQARGVELEPFAVAAHLDRELGGRGAQLERPRRELLRARVDLARRPRARRTRRPRASAAPSSRGERPLGRRCALQQPPGVVEPGRLELELVGLAGARRRGLDLAHLVREQIHLAFAIAFAFVELGERRPSRRAGDRARRAGPRRRRGAPRPRTGRGTASGRPSRAAAGPRAGRGPRRARRRAPPARTRAPAARSTRAVLRPSAVTVRASRTSPSSAHPALVAAGGASNRACTFAAGAPARTSEAPPRRPSASAARPSPSSCRPRSRR